MTSYEKPTDEQVERAVSLIGQANQRRHFFDQLQNPEWIGPLRKKGYFTRPPSPQMTEKKDAFQLPPWPESQYLARMASASPKEVLEIILRMPLTENVRVHEDFADAAVGMPPALAAGLVAEAKKWLGARFQLRLPDKLGKLMLHLAEGGEADAAMRLAKALLEVFPNPRARERRAEFGFVPEPTAHCDAWTYGELLKDYYVRVGKIIGMPALILACNLLDKAMRIYTNRSDKKYPGPEDLSSIWRPAIEDHAQNQVHSIKNALVSCVRDLSILLVKERKAEIAIVLETIEKQRWRVFHRIALYLLSQCPNEAREVLPPYITNRDSFDAHWARHEYANLLRTGFDRLSPTQQEVVLDWIDEGPDMNKFKEWVKKEFGRDATEKECKTYKKGWQRDRLSFIEGKLPEPWKYEYETLLMDVGRAEHPDFSFYMEPMLMGPESPINPEDLRSKRVAELVDFLKTWKPLQQEDAPSPEGLGRQVSDLVAQEPDRFAREARLFCGLDPTYVRALLSGLRSAVRGQRTFAWVPALELCSWVVKQPREIPGRVIRTFDADPDWVESRKAIANLLWEGMAHNAGLIMEHRNAIWNILLPLSEDPDPTPEYEASYMSMGPAGLAINVTRGCAMNAVMQYACWVQRLAGRNGREGFDEMPEVREVLEKHLDVNLDPSVAVLSAYGRWFPALLALDRAWATSHASQIFPTSELQKDRWKASWNTYIVFCPATVGMLRVLAQQYGTAIDRLSESSGEGIHYGDPRVCLGQHLMVFYWLGDFADPTLEPLFERFWNKADNSVRGLAIDFIGNSLYRTEGLIPPKCLELLRKLWEQRLSAAKQVGNPAEHEGEMAAFGWWFASGKFDDDWSLDQLAAAAEISGKVEGEHLVGDRLVALVPARAKKVLMSFAALVRGDREGWHIYHWKEQLRKALAAACQDDDCDIVVAAEKLIDDLGRRGYSEFGELLR